MTDTFRSLCVDLVRISDAMNGGKPSIANQGQALDGFSALANFRAIADAARKELAKPQETALVRDPDEVEAPVHHHGNDWEVQVAADPRTGPNALQKPKSFAEEPPTANDADEDSLVWGLDAHLSWKRTHWRLIGRHGYQYWLPLWALPFPTADEDL